MNRSLELSIDTRRPEPTFRAGSFDIHHFTSDPEGLRVNAEGVGRVALEPLYPTPEERKAIGEAVKSDLVFRGAQRVRDARTAWREAIVTGATAEEQTKLKSKFEDERNGYSQKGNKIGFRGWHTDPEDPSLLIANAVTVPFMVYNRLSKPKGPEDSESILPLSEASGVAMALRTADSRLILQHRAVKTLDLETGETRPGNASYCDIPGASIAGMADATKKGKSRERGAPDMVTTETLTGNIMKEAGEELGLDAADIQSTRIVAIGHDNIKPHDEILFLAETILTADEVRQNAQSSNRNRSLAPEDLEEKFFDIEATPEAVEALLADVHCPLPPTHAATFVAAGFMMVLESTGSQVEAEAWAAQLEDRVRENYMSMDAMVRDYYTKHPEALDIVPERMWSRPMPRNREGYSPHFTPSEQGLPELEDELVRTGLVPETRTRVDTAYLFDVDGVLTDPVEKRVDREEIFSEIIARLQSGQPVAFNTGRSSKWVFDNVIAPMLEQVEDKSIMQNAIIIGEKGGSWALFNKHGEAQHHIVSNIGIPAELQEQIASLIGQKYSHLMDNLDPKETMFSIEMHDGMSLDAFHAAQYELVQELQALVGAAGLTGKLRVDATTIATDIENPHVGKALGTERFMEFLKLRGIKPDRFVAFGDSPSDLAMTDELARRGKNVEMIYVGDPAKLPSQTRSYSITRRPGHTAATAAYLTTRRG